MKKVEQAIWISGSEKLPIMYMNESHIQNAINKLSSFKGNKFKNLNKNYTLNALITELEYKKQAKEFINNFIIQKQQRKQKHIYQTISQFTNRIGMKKI